jgi:probable O-glycosylation ligase (exosortase A-associated)
MRTITLLIIYYGCVFYTLTNPTFGLLFFIHITIFRPESLVWGNLAFGRLHLITSISVLIAYLIQKNLHVQSIDDTYRKKNIHLFFFFILWLVIVSIFAEYSVQISFDKTVEVAKIFAICFLFARLINTEGRIEVYVWVISISFGLLSFWGILQGLAGNPRLDELWPGGSNYLAVQQALIAPLIFAKVLDPTLSMKYRMIFFVCTLCIILCCIYTDSRGGFLGLSAGMFIFTLRIKQRVKALAGFMMLVFLAAPLIPAHYSDRITSIFAKQEAQDASAALRPVLWQIALRIWQDHPIAGVGLENFSPAKETYSNQDSDIVPEQLFGLIFGRERYTHGLYPGMIAETGLVGMSLFLLLLLRNIFYRFPVAFVRAKSQYHLYLQVRGAQAGLVGFAVAAVFGDFQYIEMLYLQIFFVATVQDYMLSSIGHSQTGVGKPRFPISLRQADSGSSREWSPS